MSILRVVILTLLIALAAGCGDDGTRAEADGAALRDAERALRGELEAAAAAVGLEPTFERVAPAPCEAAGGPTESVTGGLRARMAVSGQDAAALLGRAERHWRAAGHDVERRGEGTGVPGVFVATSSGASMSLRVVDGSTAILAGGTPCVPG